MSLIKINKGDRYNRLVAIEEVFSDEYSQRWFLFKCDCGVIKKIRLASVRSGNSMSCGCMQKELVSKKFKTHGMKRTRIYDIWKGIIRRCKNKNCKAYYSYGGRGIGICDKWLKFEGFYEDMKDEYKDHLTIDRIDNEKGYLKENCRWATKSEQARNRSRVVIFNNMTTSEASLKMGGNYNFVRLRISTGWKIEDAFTIPRGGKKPKYSN